MDVRGPAHREGVCAVVGHHTGDKVSLNCEHWPFKGLQLYWQYVAPLMLLGGSNILY